MAATDYSGIVQKGYRDVLGREADQPGAEYWQGQLQSGAVTPESFQKSLLSGAKPGEFGEFVEEGYQNVLGRKSDVPGKDYWSGQLRSGAVKPKDFAKSLASGVIKAPTQTPTYQPYSAPKVTSTAESMKGLLETGSPYLTAARQRGKEYAASRGLLDSSIAAGAAERAAIESALPIAQQDAAYSQQLGTIAAQEAASGRLSAQEATQMLGLSAQEAAQRLGLSAQEAEQVLGLSAQEAAQALGLSDQEYKQKLGTIAAQEVASGRLSAQEAAQALGLSEQEFNQQMGMSQLESEQALALEKVQQEGANLRQQAELDLKERMDKMQLGSQERTSLGSAVTNLGESFSEQIANINRDPNVEPDAKTAAIETLSNAYQANLESLMSVYGVTIDWSPLQNVPVAEEETPETPEDKYNTEERPPGIYQEGPGGDR